MNLWDILILLAVGALVFLAARQIRRNHRSGGCGCGCEGCKRSCKEQKETK
jgi:hypothetical protein